MISEIARERGLKFVSFGDDPNAYGIDSTHGLLQFKSSTGMRVVISVPFDPNQPSALGKFQLIKPLAKNMDKIRFRTDDKDQGLFVFGVKGTGQARVEAYHRLVAVKGTDVPYLERMNRVGAELQGFQMLAHRAGDKCKTPDGMEITRLGDVECAR